MKKEHIEWELYRVEWFVPSISIFHSFSEYLRWKLKPMTGMDMQRNKKWMKWSSITEVTTGEQMRGKYRKVFIQHAGNWKQDDRNKVKLQYWKTAQNTEPDISQSRVQTLRFSKVDKKFQWKCEFSMRNESLLNSKTVEGKHCEFAIVLDLGSEESEMRSVHNEREK